MDSESWTNNPPHLGNGAIIGGKKSHIGFRLVPNSVTLNDIERHKGRHFLLFHRIRMLS